MFPGNITNHGISPPSNCIEAPRGDDNRMPAGGAVSNVTSAPSNLAPFRPRPGGELVTLNNGKEVPRSAVVSTLISLHSFAEMTGALGLEELNKKCHSPSHKMDGAIGEMAEKRELIGDGKMDAIKRDIILSSVKSVGIDWYIEDPLSKTYYVPLNER